MFPWKLTRTLWTGGEPKMRNTQRWQGRQVYAWHQHTAREMFSLEQEEDEHFREDCVHATILER